MCTNSLYGQVPETSMRKILNKGERLPRAGGRERGGAGRRAQTSGSKMSQSWDLRHSAVTAGNDTALDT